MEKILMGKVVNVVGLKGEVKIYSYTDRNERFEELDQIWLDNKAYAIENVAVKADYAVFIVFVYRLEFYVGSLSQLVSGYAVLV